MPLIRPTLAELVLRYEQDMAARLDLGQLIPEGPASAIAHVIAAMAHDENGAIANEVLELWPDTCLASSLDTWGFRFTLPRKAAVAAFGTVVFLGTNGAQIPLNAEVQRADGQRFRTTALATIVGGASSAPVVAVLAGSAGVTAPLTSLTLNTAVVGGSVSSISVDASGLVNGADVEEDEDFRRRLIQRWRNPPGSGQAADYVRWATSIAGVTRAWCLPANQGPGTIGVTFVCDNDPLSIIPSPAKVAEVLAFILTQRPEPVPVAVFAPTLLAVNFTLHIAPDSTDLRAATIVSLGDLFLREGGPALTIPLSHVRQAISLTPGLNDYVLTVPASDLVLAGGQIPVVGVVTWT